MMNRVQKKVAGYVFRSYLNKLREAVRGKEIILHIILAAILACVAIGIWVFIFVMYCTVEGLAVLWYFFYVAIPFILFFLILLPGVYVFYQSSMSFFWRKLRNSHSSNQTAVHGIFFGVLAWVLPFLIELLLIVILASLWCLFGGAKHYNDYFYSTLYGLSHNYGHHGKLNGFELAFSATVVGFSSALLEEGFKFLLVFLFIYIVVNHEEMFRRKYTDVLYSICISFGLGATACLFWGYLYLTILDKDNCYYCKSWPKKIKTGDKWGIAMSLWASRMMLQLGCHLCNGIIMGCFLGLARGSSHLGYILSGLLIPTFNHFFFDFISMGFNERLTYARDGALDVLCMLAILTGLDILLALGAGFMLFWYHKSVSDDDEEQDRHDGPPTGRGSMSHESERRRETEDIDDPDDMDGF